MRHSQSALRTVDVDKAIPPGLIYVECEHCHDKTVARSLAAPTLVGWSNVSLLTGRGICPGCNGNQEMSKKQTAPAAGYWVFETVDVVVPAAKDSKRMVRESRPSGRIPARVASPEAYRGSKVALFPALPGETATEAMNALTSYAGLGGGWVWSGNRKEATRWVEREKAAHVEQAEALFDVEAYAGTPDDMQVAETIGGGTLVVVRPKGRKGRRELA